MELDRNSNDNAMSDHPTWRRSESISIATMICVVVGWVWIAATRAKAWDIVMDEHKGNDVLDHRVTVMETNMSEMMEDVKWIRRHLK